MNIEEAEKPIRDYRSVDEWFTRGLKSKCRPIAKAESILSSPADGTILNYGHIKNNSLIQAKRIDYSLNSLIPSDLSHHFKNGFFATIYLSPKDCHRVFSPVDGRIIGYLHVPGSIFPVREPYLSTVKGLFTRNERLVTFIKNKKGLLALVQVAAFNVGNMSVTYDAGICLNDASKGIQEKRYNEPLFILKGDWLATFHLGSTVILLCSSEMTLKPLRENGAIRYGEEWFRFL